MAADRKLWLAETGAWANGLAMIAEFCCAGGYAPDRPAIRARGRKATDLMVIFPENPPRIVARDLSSSSVVIPKIDHARNP